MPVARRRIGLYLDTYLSPALMAHVVELCRDLDAGLLCLAPPPGNLAVSRLEPHLAALACTGVEWEMRPVAGEVGRDLAGLPEMLRLVCEGGSALGRHRGALPAPLVILLNPVTPLSRPQARPAPEIDWLAPRLHRGF